MRRLTIGGLDLAGIDANDANVQYMYDEIFGARIYDFEQMRLPERPTIIDIGANIGLYTIWAQQHYRPRAVYCYEASPRTYACLRDNIRWLIPGQETDVHPLNHAIARTAGQTLRLNQSTKVSGISTLLGRGTVSWVEQAAARQELELHEVVTSTVSAEIEKHRLAAVDILKIDVEGYFLEVLKGIAPDDFAKIRNIVMEVDYLPETGIKPHEVEDLLQAMGYSTDCLDRSLDNNLTFYAWRS